MNFSGSIYNVHSKGLLYKNVHPVILQRETKSTQTMHDYMRKIMSTISIIKYVTFTHKQNIQQAC